MVLKFKPTDFEDIEIFYGPGIRSITFFQGSEYVIVDKTDLPRFIHELKIVENEGNKID
jgi:hypothetical protein